jgi:hypothetical protein
MFGSAGDCNWPGAPVPQQDRHWGKADGRGNAVGNRQLTSWALANGRPDCARHGARVMMGAAGARSDPPHMWFDLAAAHFPASDVDDRNAATKERDLVPAKMTPQEIAEA